ncbi:Rcn2-prov protein, related [Neospora caninum Liverpool]|uniref:Rcn2-prov protein, related n=1 Tax=Neospora caninum (strain Liverpool) TaxID=572307 RepID=F0VHP4_NEOCL|nr:Rcn2-prov protein, related [Neospora caninum Liverpool]CBZ53255.1 Rcn2-prov protein, related [Neospora caninum Liverpool]CEL67241.1 TPA: Rcn2-prov protein, related [Neospora caninum Liverpool]|eukprot:XP_003883287.1 Rcn2-prov protein, related [Neospora caninum Liverpool]
MRRFAESANPLGSSGAVVLRAPAGLAAWGQRRTERSALSLSRLVSSLVLLAFSPLFFGAFFSAAPAHLAEAAASKLSGEKLAELMQMDLKDIKERMLALFELIDANHDNEIDTEEAKEWSTKLKNAMHQHQVRMEFQAIDKDADGKVSLAELEATYVDGQDQKQLEQHKKEVEQRFKAVDKNNDGLLDMAEIRILMDPGKDDGLMKIEIEEILTAQDKDGDRKITLSEFIETEGTGSITDAEKAELEKEFKSYDVNADGTIDEGELQQIIKDPHAHEIRLLLEEFAKDLKDGKVGKEQWEKEFESFAVSMLTDNGEVLRFPEDYTGIEFPFKTVVPKVEGVEDDEKHDEL